MTGPTPPRRRPISMHGHRLGRLPSLEKNVARRVRLRDFFDHKALLPALPDVFAPPSGFFAPMYGNDQAGDCGPAACAHVVGQNSLVSTGTERLFTAQEVLDWYYRITGGSDSGVDNESMFSFWKRNPLVDEELIAYAALDPGDQEQFEAAMWAFEGGVVLGLSLPDRCVPSGGNWLAIPWTGTSGAPDPWNGHDVQTPGWASRGGPYFVATWADVRARMDLPFYAKYGDSPWLLLTRSIINKGTQKSGNNFDLNGLLDQVGAITGTRPPTPPSPDPSPRPTVSISVTPGTIAAGGSSLLDWATENATEATLDDGETGPLSVVLNGQLAVSPVQSTTYVVAATGPGGSASASADLIVEGSGPAPGPSPSPTPKPKHGCGWLAAALLIGAAVVGLVLYLLRRAL